MGILELLLGGGVTGLFGSIITQVMGVWKGAEDRKNRKLDYAHELKLQEMQLASLKEETEREVLIASEQGQSAAFVASYNHAALGIDKAAPWAINVLQLFRPGITAFLIICTMLIYFTTTDPELAAVITHAIIYGAVMALSWWFSDRGINKAMAQRLFSQGR
jgi:hypothetical protein